MLTGYGRVSDSATKLHLKAAGSGASPAFNYSASSNQKPVSHLWIAHGGVHAIVTMILPL